VTSHPAASRALHHQSHTTTSQTTLRSSTMPVSALRAAGVGFEPTIEGSPRCRFSRPAAGTGLQPANVLATACTGPSFPAGVGVLIQILVGFPWLVLACAGGHARVGLGRPTVRGVGSRDAPAVPPLVVSRGRAAYQGAAQRPRRIHHDPISGIPIRVCLVFIPAAGDTLPAGGTPRRGWGHPARARGAPQRHHRSARGE
jgi:hypothetical protein